MALILKVVAVVLLLGAIAVVVAWWAWSAAISADIARLRSAAQPVTDGTITAEQVAELPPPAVRYFTWAGVIGTTIPRLVRLTQKGRIRSSAEAGWMPLEAEEIYSTNPPGFVWRAGLPSLRLPVVLGRDEYLENAGSIEMRMLSLLPVARETGDEVRAAGLMRYLNEMMWFPAAYLGANVTISPVSDEAFGVRIADRGLAAEAVLYVGLEGRPTNFLATRFNTTTRSLETWETPISAWAMIAGLELPRQGAADWKLANADLRYIELEVTYVSYEP